MRCKILGLVLMIALFITPVAHGRAPEQSMTLLNAATSTGTGSIENLSVTYKSFTCTILYGGTVTAATVRLDGSTDRTNFFELGNTTTIVDDMFHVANKGVRFVRGNVTTLTGTAPTVTLKCSAGGN